MDDIGIVSKLFSSFSGQLTELFVNAKLSSIILNFADQFNDIIDILYSLCIKRKST